MMHKIRALLLEPLPIDNAVVRQALDIAFGETETMSAQSFSKEHESVDIVVAAFPAAHAIEESLTDSNHSTPAFLLLGLGAGTLDYGEVIDEIDWTPANLPRAFRVASHLYKLSSENRRLRGDLLTTARRLSHDLRSPLGCIHTNGDMIKELGSAALDEETLRESAGLILDSAKEATALINRVALVLRASAETPKMEPVDSGIAFKEAFDSLSLPTSTVSSPETWPRVTAVQSLLTTIWTNLLENAVRHGGQAAKIQVGWQENAGSIQFSVTDTGPGIPNHLIPVIFRPFEQLHLTHSGGLGLSIVHRLVTLMGGTCGHQIPPAGGACFTFSLPKVG